MIGGVPVTMEIEVTRTEEEKATAAEVTAEEVTAAEVAATEEDAAAETTEISIPPAAAAGSPTTRLRLSKHSLTPQPIRGPDQR